MKKKNTKRKWKLKIRMSLALSSSAEWIREPKERDDTQDMGIAYIHVNHILPPLPLLTAVAAVYIRQTKKIPCHVWAAGSTLSSPERPNVTSISKAPAAV